MLQAFIDDSGWDGNSPVFVLAGYVAKAEQWAAFSKEWQVILDRQEPSRIGVLKTKDIYRNRVPNTSFHGWTDDQRDARLKSFIEAINRYAMHGIVSVIPLEPYQRLMEGKFNPDILDRPYFLSFFGVIVNLLKLTHRLKLDDKLEIVFDTQDVDKALLTSEYEKCMAVAPPQVRELCVGMPTFQKDEEALPLQAADLIAWHARRYYFDEFSGKDPSKEQSNRFFANMFNPKHDIFDLWTEDRLNEVMQILLRSASPRKTEYKNTKMTIPTELFGGSARRAD